MKRTIFQPIKIENFQTDSIECAPQSNAFFELVFVKSGAGSRLVNNFSIPFEQGDLFLHLPDEVNSISLKEQSTLHFIKFQKVFFDKQHQKAFEIKQWFNKIEFILSGSNNQKKSIINIEEDKHAVRKLVDLILEEYHKTKGYHKLNTKALLFVLLNITARNILNDNPTDGSGNNQNDKKTDLLNYINYHILDADKITIENLSKQFAISHNYFSEYFKKTFGTSFKQYILEYKVKLAESKLKYTNLTLSEIAAELGFTDVNHFNKTFYKRRNKLPSEITS